MPWFTPMASPSLLLFVLITFLHVILGELVPKSLALQRAEQVALGGCGTHGCVPDPDPSAAFRDEPGRGVGTAHIRLPPNPARPSALTRTN